jgi:UDP-2,3-diacylglucosamine pyrophosphatase LpxH
MLIFISDLHFVDGTAGEHNPPTKAFEYFFDDLVAIAGKESNTIKEIKIVLLGDVFDLLRTEKWFSYAENERPWGNDEAAIEQNALDIFDAIMFHGENSNTFTIIRDQLKGLKDRCEREARCQLESDPRLFYIPGNHDRLVNKYGSLRVKVCECLGIPRQQHSPADPFPHNYEDLPYGVFARHGHEFDKFNYEGGESYGELDYLRVPIGDPITTELVAGLPFTLRKNLQNTAHSIWPNLSAAEVAIEIAKINRNFQEIENVRPLSSVIEWLLYQVKQNRWLKEVVEDSVIEVADNFDKLEFVKLWYERHDKWTNWLDEADKIQAVLFLFRNFKLYRTEKLWELVIKAKDYFVKDDLLEAAPQEYLHLPPGIQYVVYGHTHDPLVMPLRTVPGPAAVLEQVYLNTGTWRDRHWKATQDASFISWKNMTYVIFYRDEERTGRKADFETWTGAQK